MVSSASSRKVGHVLLNNICWYIIFLRHPPSSDTRYCQIHHFTVDSVRISSLDMSQPMMAATRGPTHNLENRCVKFIRFACDPGSMLGGSREASSSPWCQSSSCFSPSSPGIRSCMYGPVCLASSTLDFSMMEIFWSHKTLVSFLLLDHEVRFARESAH